MARGSMAVWMDGKRVTKSGMRRGRSMCSPIPEDVHDEVFSEHICILVASG
jgi:hypothetical protein